MRHRSWIESIGVSDCTPSSVSIQRRDKLSTIWISCPRSDRCRQVGTANKSVAAQNRDAHGALLEAYDPGSYGMSVTLHDVRVGWAATRPQDVGSSPPEQRHRAGAAGSLADSGPSSKGAAIVTRSAPAPPPAVPRNPHADQCPHPEAKRKPRHQPPSSRQRRIRRRTSDMPWVGGIDDPRPRLACQVVSKNAHDRLFPCLATIATSPSMAKESGEKMNESIIPAICAKFPCGNASK